MSHSCNFAEPCRGYRGLLADRDELQREIERRGVAWDIIDEAISTYDEWMLEDDYEAMIILHKIIKRMKERRAELGARKCQS